MDRIPSKLIAALGTLLEALEYADDVGSDRWEFAVSVSELLSCGCVHNDLRWLVRRGYVEHAREVTVRGEDGRSFSPTGDMTFTKRSCFVLTDHGRSRAPAIFAQRPIEPLDGHDIDGDANVTRDVSVASVACKPAINGHSAGLGSYSGNGASPSGKLTERLSSSQPCWNSCDRTLRVGDDVVKHFKWRAANQEAILNAFEEEGWPPRVDDPLPPQVDQDAKRRLSDTIKGLNKKQIQQLIRFHGDGTGEGITWEWIGNGPELASDSDRERQAEGTTADQEV